MFAEFFNLFQSHHVGQLQVSKEGFFWVVILKNILRRTQWDPTVLVIWQWWYRSSSTFGKKIHVLFIFGSNNGAVLRKKNYVITLRLQLVYEILEVHRSVKNPTSFNLFLKLLMLPKQKCFQAYSYNELSVFCQLETKGKLQRKRIHSSLQSTSA